MRLIDADWLFNLYADSEGIDFRVYNVPIPVVRQNILDAPTIELQVVHGQWQWDGNMCKFRCSNCGGAMEFKAPGCPWCFAHMEEVGLE